jgi:hypothetical protein
MQLDPWAVFTADFTVSFLFAFFVLMLCKVIPPVRPRLGLSYGVAIAAAFAPNFVLSAGPELRAFAAAAVTAVILFVMYLRARAKRPPATEQ